MKKSLIVEHAIRSLAACAAGPPQAAMESSGTNKAAAAAKTKAGAEIMLSTTDAMGAAG